MNFSFLYSTCILYTHTCICLYVYIFVEIRMHAWICKTSAMLCRVCIPPKTPSFSFVHEYPFISCQLLFLWNIIIGFIMNFSFLYSPFIIYTHAHAHVYVYICIYICGNTHAYVNMQNSSHAFCQVGFIHPQPPVGEAFSSLSEKRNDLELVRNDIFFFDHIQGARNHT